MTNSHHQNSPQIFEERVGKKGVLNHPFQKYVVPKGWVFLKSFG